MLKLSVIEFIGRLVPEVLLFIFATYTFSKIKINLKKYILSTIMLGTCIFFIRMLPINYGVHTILNIVALTLIVICVNKIDSIKAIKASIITAILLFVCEGVNVAMLNVIMGDRFRNVLSDTTLKTLYGAPSLVAFGLIVITNYLFLNRKGNLECV